MDIKEALAAMQNLGVSLNDYDSEALNEICNFVYDAISISNGLHHFPAPDRVMWQYGVEIKHYTQDQMVKYDELAIASKT